MALLEVADVLDEQGRFKRESEVRSALSFNGRRRPIYWINPKVGEALDAYFFEQLKLGHGVSAWRAQGRGMVQLGSVLLTNDGKPFTLTTHKTGAGNTSRSCESLTRVIGKLHDQAGIQATRANAAWRTFGVRLHRRR